MGDGTTSTDAPVTRRLIGLQREYRCSVGHEHRSWAGLRACPDCREPLSVAVIRRAAWAPSG